MKVTAEINSSTSSGEKIIQELENNKKQVKVAYHFPVEKNGLVEETFSVEEVFNEVDEKLKKHYEKQVKPSILEESITFTHEEFVKKVKDKFTETYGVNFDEL